jgi:hypothetical protein
LVLLLEYAALIGTVTGVCSIDWYCYWSMQH